MSSESGKVFGYFVSLSTVLGLINWINIIITYYCFQQGIQAQGITIAGLPWKSALQPYAVYITFFITSLVIIFNGYTAFVGGFKVDKFITSYLGVVIYILNIMVYKLWKGSKRVNIQEMDLVSDRRLYDDDLEEETVRKTFFQRLASALWGS